MPIEGIYLEQEGQTCLCRVDLFSDSLKELIRKQLASIAYGGATAESNPEFYSYQLTLQSFLERYQTKSDDIKKGMVGELLSHILIPICYADLTSLSVFFNKEERQIKKGFDIIYFRLTDNILWYTEVKSGSPNGGKPDASNTTLLKRAKTDIQEKFLERRHSLWESALADAHLVLGESKLPNAKTLLSKDSPLLQGTTQSDDKNVILISVLYECPTTPCTIGSLTNFYTEVDNEKLFKGSIVFSIQKKTYERVAEFLESEVKDFIANG